MCTAITYEKDDFYFGRTLDWKCSYGEEIVISPRNFPFHFRKMPSINTHFAIIGVAIIENGYPLYYDAINEKGLCIAGLNFPDNADYKPENRLAYNITPFELIPWILCQCSSTEQARALLEKTNILNINFSSEYSLSPLHWIISDKNSSITVEPVKTGINIYDNPIGVLTNNPTFDYHMTNLNNYMMLSNKQPDNNFSKRIEMKPYSFGMGAIGLPGDLSSASRFVRASFAKCNSICGNGELEIVSQFFHILGSVEQQRGCACINQDYEYTIYTTCCNADKGIYYYKTYDNSSISAVNMNNEKLNATDLICYKLNREQKIEYQN